MYIVAPMTTGVFCHLRPGVLVSNSHALVSRVTFSGVICVSVEKRVCPGVVAVGGPVVLRDDRGGGTLHQSRDEQQSLVHLLPRLAVRPPLHIWSQKGIPKRCPEPSRDHARQPRVGPSMDRRSVDPHERSIDRDSRQNRYLIANCMTRASATVLVMRPKLALPSVDVRVAEVHAVGQVERLGAQLDSMFVGASAARATARGRCSRRPARAGTRAACRPTLPAYWARRRRC